MSAWVTRRRLSAFIERLAQEFPSLARDISRLLDGAAETVELAGEVVYGGLQPPSQHPTAIGKEEITRGPSDDRADNCRCQHF